MRKIVLLSVCLTGSILYGQSLTPTVVASAGDYFSNSSTSLSWTLGEVVTDSYFGTNNQLTQGFQQPMESYAGIETTEVQGAFTVFPNPSRNVIQISALNTTGQYYLTLTDFTGQIILTESYNANLIHTLSLDQLAAGMYLLQIIDTNGVPVEIFKIQKL
ncbi:MAG: T9SS type A sorting domain-containing protein [Crocinitomicaceae bacterium]|nr:T9SS type A sorting domain-containing protein [Crocinitomicaceae bacterium]MBK8924847.1 T9SS type A sorting domain-containing protein [Crocinitomicaceae bacterium]